MSQSKSFNPRMSSGVKAALGVGIAALVIGATALGLTVYQGYVSVPNQVSGFPQVNQTPTTVNVTLEFWAPTSPPGSDQDRFFPDYITIAQGDTVNLLFVSNDTGDGHTFTIMLPTSKPGYFQLNNSLPGQFNPLKGQAFNTDPKGCSDQFGQSVGCNTVTQYHSTIGSETSSGSFTVKVPGTYRFWDVYHQNIGMYGWLIVLPNKAFTG